MTEGTSTELVPGSDPGESGVPEAATAPEPLLQPARDLLFQQLLEMKRKLEYDIKEANGELKAANGKRLEIGCELKLRQDTIAGILQRRAAVQAERDAVYCKQAEADADTKRPQTELRKERELTSRKKDRLQDLEAELKKLMMSVHLSEVQQESQAAQVGVAQQAARVAREHAQYSMKHATSQEVLLDLLRGRLEKTKQATSERQVSSDRLLKLATERKAHARGIEQAREAVDAEAVALGRRWEQALSRVSRADAELVSIEDACNLQRSKVLRSRSALCGAQEESQECGKRSLALSSRVRHVELHKRSLLHSLAASQERKASTEADITAVCEKESSAVALCEAGLAALTRAERDAKDLHAERCRLEAACQELQRQLEELLMKRAESGRGGKVSLIEMRALHKAIAAEESSIQEMRPQIDELRSKADGEAARARGLEADLQAAETAVQAIETRCNIAQNDVKGLLRAIEGRIREEHAANRELHRLGCAGEGEDSAPLQNEVYNLASAVSKKQRAIVNLKKDWTELQLQFLAAHTRNTELAQNERAEHQELFSLELQKEMFIQEERETEAKIVHLEKELHAVASKCNRMDASSHSLGRGIDAETNRLTSATLSMLSLHQDCKKREEQLNSLLAERERGLALVAQVRQQIMASSHEAEASTDTGKKRIKYKENGVIKQAKNQVAQLERKLGAAKRRRSKAAVALEQATRAHCAALQSASN